MEERSIMHVWKKGVLCKYGRKEYYASMEESSIMQVWKKGVLCTYGRKEYYARMEERSIMQRRGMQCMFMSRRVDDLLHFIGLVSSLVFHYGYYFVAKY